MAPVTEDIGVSKKSPDFLGCPDIVGRARRYCDVAGMDPEEPLRLALLTVVESAESIRQVAGELNARAREPIDRTVLDRIGRETAAVMGRHAAHYVEGTTWRATALAAGVLAAVMAAVAAAGYTGGYRHGGSDAIRAAAEIRAAVADGAPAAMAWRDLMRWNGASIQDSLRRCANARTDGPLRACDLPVWIGPLQKR